MGWYVPDIGFWEPKEKKVELSPRANKDLLNWRSIDYTSARAKFKFNIYYIKDSIQARYFIGQSPPNLLWQELKQPSKSLSFEEAKNEKYMYCRLLKDGVPHRHQNQDMTIILPRMKGKGI